MARDKLLFGGFAAPVEAKTAAYTVKMRDCGKIFTNEGAGAGVTFTLPKLGTSLKGFNVEFYSVASQVITVASDPADKLVTDTDTASDTIALANRPGSYLRVVCTGTAWLCIVGLSTPTADGTQVRPVTIVT